MLKKLGYFLFILIIVVLIASPIITIYRGMPTLAVAIRSWSMEPVFTRGDLVFILPTTNKTQFTHGQIVVFRSEENGIRDWTMHRIVDGNMEEGFITKGDNNERTDQEGSRYPAVKQEWIAGVVPTLGKIPAKMPLMVYIPLLLEQHMSNPLVIFGFLIVLALVLFVDEIFKPKKRRKKEAITKEHLFFLGGIAFAVMMAAVMLMGSLFITFPYGVEETVGVLMGSDVGIIQKGSAREIKLADLKNKGNIPFFYHVLNKDPQIIIDDTNFVIKQNNEKSISATVYGDREGLYQTNIIIGMFLPFLPHAIIKFIVKINFWLALVIVSLTPTIPLFILPFLDYRFRRNIKNKLHKRIFFLIP